MRYPFFDIRAYQQVPGTGSTAGKSHIHMYATCGFLSVLLYTYGCIMIIDFRPCMFIMNGTELAVIFSANPLERQRVLATPVETFFVIPACPDVFARVGAKAFGVILRQAQD